ncbi:MAG: GNAT family protein [Acidimicrobiales bacterium]
MVERVGLVMPTSYFADRRGGNIDVASDDFEIRSDRLILRPWRSADSSDVDTMNADPEVMADAGGPPSRAASDAKLERFRGVWLEHGITRWVVTISMTVSSATAASSCSPTITRSALTTKSAGGWLVTHGVMGSPRGGACRPHRRIRPGRLRGGFAYTAADNVRSEAVMERLGLERRSELDFARPRGVGPWHGLVWAATAPTP